MSDDFSLPPELQQLKQRLAARPCGEPPGRLRERFLASVGVQLRGAPARSRWTFAIAVAATALVWMNLSMSATQATSYVAPLDVQQASIESAAAEIRRLLPELPPQEAMREAVLLRAGAGLVACPSVAPRFDMPRGGRAWEDLLH